VTDHVEGTAVEDHAPVPESSTEVVAFTPAEAGAIIRAEQPDDIIVKASAIATSLKELIDGNGLATDMGGGRKHVNVDGWQALGFMLGALGGQPLHAETVWTRPARDPATGEAIRRTFTQHVKRYHRRDQGGGLREEVTFEVDGYDWEACVEIKTASGVVVGRAEAMCSRSEDTWARRDEYAVRSMAETRAESRAYRRAAGWLVSIAGYNPTPKEEMPHEAPSLPSWAAPCNDAQLTQLRNGLGYLLDGDADSVTAVVDRVAKDAGGTIPWIASRAVLHVAVALKTRALDSEPPDVEAVPSQEPDEPSPAEHATLDEAIAAGKVEVDQ